MVRCFEVLHGTLNASKQPFVAAVGVVEVVKDFMFEIKISCLKSSLSQEWEVQPNTKCADCQNK